MKIKSVDTIMLEYIRDDPPLPRNFALIRIETDAELVGYGEASSSYGHFYPTVVKTIIDDILRRILTGKDALDIRGRVREMRQMLEGYLGWEGITSQVIGAIEIALWDILGKHCGQPLARLLGSNAESVPLYSTGNYNPEMDLAWHAHYYDTALENGFKAIKVRLGNVPREDVEMVAYIRDYVGPDVLMMVDAYWTYNPTTAIALAKALEPYDLFFFEEPIPQYMLEGLARVRAESPVPIAVGERVYSLGGFHQVIKARAADVLQPDPTACGGILETLEIAALARAHDLIVVPHVGGLSAIGIAANLHLAAAMNSRVLEYDITPYQPLRDEMLKDPIFDLESIEDGCLRIPQVPGLGIEIDESSFERFPYEPGVAYPEIFSDYHKGDL